MATMSNLTEENVDDLKEMFTEKILKSNPYAKLEIRDRESDSVEQKIEELSERVETLTNLIKHSLDNHVLISGEWVRVVS